MYSHARVTTYFIYKKSFGNQIYIEEVEKKGHLQSIAQE